MGLLQLTRDEWIKVGAASDQVKHHLLKRSWSHFVQAVVHSYTESVLQALSASRIKSTALGSCLQLQCPGIMLPSGLVGLTVVEVPVGYDPLILMQYRSLGIPD